MKKSDILRAKEWFAIGDDELSYAELGLKDKRDKFYSQICFYCHQSAEKYLKGYLVWHDEKIEKTHDLERLCAQCVKINAGFLDFMKDCRLMNQYYIPTRYPVHYEMHKKEQAKETYKIATKIIKFIKKDLANQRLNLQSFGG